jgi:imidazolonepropionase-like amidohydrolase
MYRTILLTILLFIMGSALSAQTAKVVGLRENTPSVYAFTNAHIVTEPGKSISDGTLLIRDGLIEGIGVRVAIPADAHIIDMQGKTIYPGFIDMYAQMGIPEPGEKEPGSQSHWNLQVRSFYQAGDVYGVDEKETSAMRSQGFTVAHIVPSHGIFRGQGAIMALGAGDVSRALISRGHSQVLSMQRANTLGRSYPHSAMGSYALARQTMYDALWYGQAQRSHLTSPATTKRPEINAALDALYADIQSKKPFIFEVENEQWIGRAMAFSDEFGIPMWIYGSGYEYRHVSGWPGQKPAFIVPVNFPAIPEMASPEQSMELSLETLRHWHLAPENPSFLLRRGHAIALSSAGIKNKTDFLKNLRRAIQSGLTEEEALAALTTTPASLLGISDRYGSLAAGKTANFVIATKNIFTEEGEVLQVWIDGQKYVVKPDSDDPVGKWDILSPASMQGMRLHIEGQAPRLRGTIQKGDTNIKLQSVKFEHQRLMVSFAGDSLGMGKSLRLSAHVDQHALLGLAETASGNIFSWQASREMQQAGLEEPESRQRQTDRISLPMRYPSIDYGLTALPEAPEAVLIRQATIWTQGPAGKLEVADMLISGGRIQAIGASLTAPRNALVIEAHGMHITPGLIDPHLHTSILGNVNETANAITSETRILDVIDANNVWIYRLLAGGLTTAKLFHGSANPIGGQDAVIKMRWGATNDELVMKEAMPGLKFALGENVKRSPDRYPNTRMGTEQIIRDAFEAALAYEQNWKDWERSKRGIMPRRDLQLEPILEVLQGKRLAHVHAYRQDEMLMMMRLAEEYGFRVAAFEHTLEGYKIADELRAHGAGAVVWTDWSSFKVEAYDGILQNARLLVDAGVLTSLHSDNTQLSTRMNWEASKTMKTGLSEVDAMNLLTINPAKILRIDNKVGSLEVGKDADFVIWNGHPLSAFSTAMQTWIEGKKYFDKDDDALLREEIRAERALIMQHMSDQQKQAGTTGQREQ